MRHIFFSIALVASQITGVPAPAYAQNPFEPVLYINDRAITRYEVNQRQRFMQVLGAVNTDQKAAENALIEDRLRMFAAEQAEIEVSTEELQAGLEEFAGRAGTSAAEFTASLESEGVQSQVFRDFIEAGVAWRGVIRKRLLPQINVSEAEVDLALKRVIETPITTRVLVSELIIPAPPGQEEAALELANSIAASRPNTDQFAAAARQYSASDTASAGGRLEWLNIENLPPTLRPVLLALQPGQTTQPLTVEGAVILFHLRDTQGRLRPGAQSQVLDYMTLRLASVTTAAGLAARVQGCDDLYVQVGREIAPQITRNTLAQSEIPTLIATRLASLDPNEATVLNQGNAAELIVLCSRKPSLLAETENNIATSAEKPDNVEAAVPDLSGVPSRDVVREQVFNQKASDISNAYLEELRANAVIRRP